MIVPELTLIDRSGCHLCDEARQVVERVVADLEEQGVRVDVRHRSIEDDAALDARWHDDVPVVLIGNALHDRWQVDAERLRADLLVAADA